MANITRQDIERYAIIYATNNAGKPDGNGMYWPKKDAGRAMQFALQLGEHLSKIPEPEKIEPPFVPPIPPARRLYTSSEL